MENNCGEKKENSNRGEDDKNSYCGEREENIFENKYVHTFYEDKSREFDVTRQRHWPKTLEFLETYNRPEYIVLDDGCGNGRCILDRNIIGLDYSMGLLQQARNKRSNELVRGDAMKLPFYSNSFDLVLSIAVIHHMSTYERRVEALKEIHRVLKPSGKCLIYVWDEATKHKSKFIPIQDKDYFVTWNKNKEIKRYYYLFDLNELKTFCGACGFKIIDSGKEQESLFVILEK
ncbi:putative methyltransferase [Nosema granulosis]|uniref:Methyltransferase n=1 Tax=Nosema granulosis TaxID=83296 RepID=A0A9P6KY26_9MICR|nr:putative methyltransferase [Nosema granulosis]